jgi:hypothetical protein
MSKIGFGGDFQKVRFLHFGVRVIIILYGRACENGPW